MDTFEFEKRISDILLSLQIFKEKKLRDIS